MSLRMYTPSMQRVTRRERKRFDLIAEFDRRFKALEPDDVDGLRELAAWAEENRLRCLAAKARQAAEQGAAGA